MVDERVKMKNESQLMFRKSTIVLDYLYLHFLSFIFAPSYFPPFSYYYVNVKGRQDMHC